MAGVVDEAPGSVSGIQRQRAAARVWASEIASAEGRWFRVESEQKGKVGREMETEQA